MTYAESKLQVVEHMPLTEASEKLIVALDVEDIPAAERMVTQLEGLVDFFKVGLALQLAPGSQDFIHTLLAQHKRVFLDYKYNDIPETVRKAVERASAIGVEFLSVHGSSKVMREAVKGRSGKLKVFTVTVLTSMDLDDIKEMGYTDHSVAQLVVFRAKKALEAGCDGVIASGQEARQIKEFTKKLLVITPGIRPDGSPEDDQKRKVTPAEAIAAGADYLVLGRPITQPELYLSPRTAAEVILREMQDAINALKPAV
jgi:orotidine-5'-phosphate decarboxylase